MSVTGNRHRMTGRQRSYSGDERARADWVTENGRVRERLHVHSRTEFRECQDGLDFRCKKKRLAVRQQGVVEGLDAEAITREKEALAVRDRKRKHPAELLHALRVVLLVQMQHYLGVGVRRKAMPLLLQDRSQRAMVVNFAVEYDAKFPGLVVDRLRSPGQVHYGQPARRDRDIA